MADQIALDFTRFEARVHAIETRMLKIEAFLGMALGAVFGNEAIRNTIKVELGSEKAHELLAGVRGYVDELKARGIGGGPSS